MSHVNSATIFWKDGFGVEYGICRLDYEEWSDGTYEYRFIPDYTVIDILPMEDFGGIPGIDLDLRRETYVRRNQEPVFMTERSPSRNRVDARELMEEVGLDHYDRLEWLIRTRTRYAGDNLYVERYSPPEPLELESGRASGSRRSIIRVLSAIGRGSPLLIEGTPVGESETVVLGRTLRMILISDVGSESSGEERPGPGRKRKEMDSDTIEWARNEMASGTSGEKVAQTLGISRSTLYRRLGEKARP